MDAPTRGLRERKKAATRQRILTEALTLFRHRGFEETSVEDIAYAADVAVGTLYNYFAKKSDLLVHALTLEAEEEIARIDARVRKMRGSGVKIIFAVIEGFFAYARQYDRALLRHVMPVLLSGSEMEQLNRPYIVQLNAQIERLKADGKLSATYATDLVARTIFNLVEAEFTGWVSTESADLAATLQSLKDQVSLVLAGASAAD
ncbi:MAG: TetR/AcrR family transcriptional regulator [Sphingomonadales bacterium]|uniref:TetR/AcrR family transcriptional regulator n=1 Tax=Novosphingobium sp. AAP93 TaxID=1523427 RepID=UPI0006B8AA26|nr:TetR/AcrR family transcriptional regulator [Novosphingobium sp. AAP93]MBU6393858.1 TetR/AcrR family transcriptional regulator [Sphingomonadales bacterium]MBY0394572.1 TetR/AcrR family transcriptional regulator [Novosphingobium sp.]